MRTSEYVFLALLLLVCGPALAVDIENLRAECDSCHGPGGNSPHFDIPTIAGQTPEFLSKTLRAYRNWDRPCVKTGYRAGDTSRPKIDMCRIAAGLAPEEEAALAEYYGQQPFQPAAQEFDADLAAAGADIHMELCETCHEEGGTLAGRGPRLAGQWKTYLKATLKFVPTGEHLVPPMMERKIADFTQEDIEKLLNYYASQQN